MAAADGSPLTLVVFSGDFPRVHYALMMAAAALAVGRATTLFFAMDATRALERADDGGHPGWTRLAAAGAISPAEADAALRARGAAGFEELLAACLALGGRVMVCETGLVALGLTAAALRPDVPLHPGGLAGVMSAAGAIVFV